MKKFYNFKRYLFLSMFSMVYFTGISQINYFQDFNNSSAGWTMFNSTGQTVEAPRSYPYTCTGTNSLSCYMYSDKNGYVIANRFNSPNIGISTGTPITMTYKYRAMYYNGPDVWVSSSSIGFPGFFWEFSTDNQNWTIIPNSLISSANYQSSTNCNTITLSFTPAVSSQIYIRATMYRINYGITHQIDNVSLIQTNPPNCTGTPNTPVVNSSQSNFCAGSPINLSLSNFTYNLGVQYQWQMKSINSSTWTNVRSPMTNSTFRTIDTLFPDSVMVRATATCLLNSNIATSNSISLNRKNFLDCYCKPSYNVSGNLIGKVQIGSLSDIPFPVTVNPYDLYSYTGYNVFYGLYGYNNRSLIQPSVIQIPNLIKGSSYSTFVSGGYGKSNYAKLCIDFNKNAEFETNECFTPQYGIYGASYTPSLNVPISPTALTGQTLMRATIEKEYNINPCGSYTDGVACDYIVNIVQPTNACSAINAGTCVSSVSNACLNENFTLNKNAIDTFTGINYQWQTRLVSSATWSNLGGNQTSSLYTTSLDADRQYRLIATCSFSTLSDTSAPITVNYKYLSCPCVPPAPLNTCNGDHITSIQLATMSLAGLGCSPAYEDVSLSQSSTINIPQLPRNTTYTFKVGVGNSSTKYLGAWIDMNHDGIFQSTEYSAIGSGNNSTISSSLGIPWFCSIGYTKVRLRTRKDTAFSPNDACTKIGRGTTRDFIINVLPSPNCLPPSANLISKTNNSVTVAITMPTGGSVSTTKYRYLVTTTASIPSAGTPILDSTPNLTLSNLNSNTIYYLHLQGSCDSFGLGTWSSSPLEIYTGYCHPNFGIGAFYQHLNYIHQVAIPNTSLSVNTNSYSNSFYGYNTYSDTITSQTATLKKTVSYTIQLSLDATGNLGSPSGIGCWIDYNRNNSYESSEFSRGVINGNSCFIPITIPAGANIGKTGLRVKANNGLDSNSMCYSSFGEVEDFILTIDSAPGCVPPYQLNSDSVTGTSAKISWVQNPISSGLTGYEYAVSTSPANPSGSGSATSSPYAYLSSLSSGNIYNYFVRSMCGSSQSPWVSGVFNNGYCIPNSTSVTNLGITNLSFGRTSNIVNNSSGSESGSGFYGNYSSQIGNLYMGQQDTISIRLETNSSDYQYAAYIDFNDDYDFVDAGELIASGVSGTTSPNTQLAIFTIPYSTNLGNHRLRIVAGDTASPSTCSSGNPLQGFEDYTVNIISAPACTSTPSAGTAYTSDSIGCAGYLYDIKLKLKGNTAFQSGIQYQWQSKLAHSSTWNNLGSVQNLPTYNLDSVIENTSYRVISTCLNGGTSATSSPVNISLKNCDYNSSFYNASDYNSIQYSGINFSSISNADNGKTNIVSLVGTSFKYRGEPINSFYATTNGWLTFNTGQSSTTEINSIVSNTQNLVLAPFWDDLTLLNNLSSNLNNCMKYKIIGTLGSDTAKIIIEWANMHRVGNPNSNLSFQVILNEGSNDIEYNYGILKLYDGNSAGTPYSYSIGMNGSNPEINSGSQRTIIQKSNTGLNSSNEQINLGISPFCNSKFIFSPSGKINSNLVNTNLPPINDDTSGIIAISINNSPCTDICNTKYSSKNASSSASIVAACSGNVDDDVWFKFEYNSSKPVRISIRPSPGYNLAYQILEKHSSGWISYDCRNSNPSGFSEDSIYTSLPLRTYYLRVYDAGLGSGGSGEFSICISDTISPPQNDNPTIVDSISLSTSCFLRPYIGRSLQLATATSSVQICNSTNYGNPDDDVWYYFRTRSDSGAKHRIKVIGENGYDPVIQVFKGTPSSSNALSCVNSSGINGEENYETNLFSPNSDYYLRIYHAGLGASYGSFQFCIQVDTPNSCPNIIMPSTYSNILITTSSPNYPWDTAVLSWTRVPNATSYQVTYTSQYEPNFPTANTYTISNIKDSFYKLPIYFTTSYTWSVTAKNSMSTSTLICSNQDSFYTNQPCPAPITYSVLNLKDTSATVRWSKLTPPTSSFIGYPYELRLYGSPGSGFNGLVKSGIITTTGTASNLDTFLILNGLIPEMNYVFYVKFDCQYTKSNWVSQKFYTGFCFPSSNSVDSFGITNVSFGRSPFIVNNSSTDEAPTNYGYYVYKSGSVVRGITDTIKITLNTKNQPYYTKVYIDLNGDYGFDTTEILYSGISGTSSPFKLTGAYTVPSSTPLGTYRMRISASKMTNNMIHCDTGLQFASFEDYTVKVIDPCDPVNEIRPITNYSNGTKLIAQCAADTSGWVYYSPISSPGTTYFAINKKNASGLINEEVQLEKLNTYLTKQSTNGTNKEHGSMLYDLGWNVNGIIPAGQSVDIRFYLNSNNNFADTQSLSSQLNTIFNTMKTATGNTASQKGNLEWFKTVGVPYDSTWRNQIIGNQFPSNHVKLTPIYGTQSSTSFTNVCYVQFNNITSFSGGSAGIGYGPPSSGGGVGLPVTWAGFEVKTIESGNELTWKTASEQNTDYFDVEYSYDGVKFQVAFAAANKIQAAGNSASLKTYQYSHSDFSSFVYYRIKQVDIDKRFDYSEIKLAKRTEGKAFQVVVYPSPLEANNILHLKLRNIDLSQIWIKMMDITGKIMLTKSLAPNANHYTDKIDMSTMAKGIYFIEVKNGQSKEVVKVVK